MDTIKEFSSIPINHSEIPQGELNIDNKTRSNLFNWNGQFSPQFIEALLRKYAEKDFMVIDPFLGSGTTVSECARQGIEAYGTELNASAFFMAKTYECSNIALNDREELVSQVDRIISSIDNNDKILDVIISNANCNQGAIGNLLSTLIVVTDSNSKVFQCD